MSDDDFNALQALAADNARLCEIVIKADALAKEVEALLEGDDNTRGTERALDAYKVVRQGT